MPEKQTPNNITSIMLSLAAILSVKFIYLAWETTSFISLSYKTTPFQHCVNTLLAASYDMPFICLCCLVAVALPKRFRPVAAGLLSLLIGVIMLIDLPHMRYYTMPASVTEIGLAGQLSHVADAALALMRPMDILLCLDLPYWAVSAYAVIDKYDKNDKRLSGFSLYSACLICISFIYCNYTATRDLYNIRFDSRSELRLAGFAVYHIHDILYAMTLQNVDDLDADEAVARKITEKRKNTTSPDLYGIARGKNLIVLQVESLQSIAIGAVSRSLDIAPNLKRLASAGMYFPNVYCQTVLGGTSDAEFMIHTGLYPTEKGVVFTNNDGREYQSLPKAMKAAGYDMAVFHADNKFYWNRHKMYPRLGIDKNYSDEDYDLKDCIGIGLSDKEFLKQTVSKIKRLNKPYYAYVITLTSHTPFGHLEAKEECGYPDVKNATLADKYFSDIKYVDAQIGMFVKGLETAGLMKNTVLLITGDHTLSPVTEDQRTLSKDPNADSVALLRNSALPVIIYGLGEAPANYMQARQIDIMPTLAGLLGIDMSEFKYASGVSLLAKEDVKRPAYCRSNGGCIILNSKNIVWKNMIYRTKDNTVLQIPLVEDPDVNIELKELYQTVYPRN